ncbi:MAG: carbamoyltransferase [Bacteroidia bacterium]
MKILGLSAFYHDSAAALIVDGEILAAAQEERFSRKKHDPSFPAQAISFCLEYGGISLDDLDAVAFYDKPLLKFERLLETYYAFAPKGLSSFIVSMPVWLKEKMFLKRLIHTELKAIGEYDRKKLILLFPEHHLSHVASAFYPSNFEDAAVMTLDGVGEWATASIASADAAGISVLKELHFPHSLGLLYSAFTYYMGFRVNSGEYKMMGLAPYGNPGSDEVKRYHAAIHEHLIKLFDDGSIWLNQDYFGYATGLRMVKDKKWENIFGLARREPETALTQSHCNLALAAQQVTEEVVVKMAAEAAKLTGSRNLCLAGGVALNCVANGKIQNAGLFDNIFIQPAAGDAGGALGAALAAYHISFQHPVQRSPLPDKMKGSYLGPEYFSHHAARAIKKHKGIFHDLQHEDALCERVAKLLSEGNIIGWMQGRIEFGPRALGNRSILGDPRNQEMQQKLNLKIKYRESFRPFAPSVLAEDARKYFELDSHSPYMLLVQSLKEEWRHPLPDHYDQFPLKEKLYYQRSEFPAITHVDFSARIQTVHKQSNPVYHRLLTEMKKRTGHGMLVNTSFNVRGEPVVCTPADAYRCFMRTEMDCLVIGNLLFLKDEQPEWHKEKGVISEELD